MLNLTYPGVYIEELPSGVHTITGVATSIAAFIGWAPQGPTNQAVLVQSFSDFGRQFGGLNSNSYLGYAVNQFFGNGGQQAYIVRLAWTDAKTAFAPNIGGTLTLYATSPGAWGNNLQVSVTQQTGNSSRFGLKVVDGSTGNVLESFANLSITASDPQYVVTVINSDSHYVTFVTPAPIVPVPTQATATTSTSGGTLAAGTYYYKVSALYEKLEGGPSNEQSIVTTGTTSSNTITWTPAGAFGSQNPTGYKIYRGTIAGNENVFYTSPIATSFTDTGADPTAGTPVAPPANTIVPVPSTQTAPTTSTSGGTLAAGKYYYKVSALYEKLEGGPSNEQSIVTTGTTSSNTITWKPAGAFGSQNPTGYKIYRGTVAGNENVFYTSPVATSFTDTGAAAIAGTPVPSTIAGVPFSNGDPGTVLKPGDGKFEPALLASLPLLDRVPIFNLLCIPGETDATTIQQVQQYCHDKRAFYIVDPPQTVTIDALTASGPANLNGQNAINAALYFPWIQSLDPLFGNRPTLFPPCGFVAGIYAATDAAIGVWKAPAGIDATLTGVSGLQYILTDAENGNLNIQGINCLRQFRTYGNVVWGARTLRGDDQIGSEWKYVPIRRLALYLESSLYNGTQWVVFEPNDERLWSQVRLNVGAFMQGLFLQGAFQGTTPRQAYFVKCDAENNPQSSIARGVVNILVGFAPLYPAEFVVIQIQQMAGQTQA
jgi:phage tail sheath protein FI